jgi:hypothetical protein
VLLLASVYLFIRGGGGSDPYSPDRMKETVVIKFADTGDEVTMTRGQLDREMRRSGDKLDPSKGVINPKTQAPTGFPFDKSEWDEMIARINQEKQEFKKAATSKPSTAPRKEVTPEEAAKALGQPVAAQPGTPPEKK